MSASLPPSVPSLSFLTTGCNRDPNGVDWLTPKSMRSTRLSQQFEEGLIAYAAATLIAIYDTKRQVVIATMRGHSKNVNAVQWMRTTNRDATSASDDFTANNSDEPFLRIVSAGVDKQIIVWRFNPITRDYTIEARLAGHEDGISAVSALHFDGGDKPYSLIASTALDLTVRIWLHGHTPSSNDTPLASDSGGWECVQVLSSGRHKIMHCLNVTPIMIPSQVTPNTFDIILALSVGGVDSKIHLWLANGNSVDSLEFIRAVSLAGHENWIRSLDWIEMDRETEVMSVASPSASSSSTSVGEKESLTAPLASFMLASASQDKHIRLWKLQVGKSDTPSDNDTIACTSLGSRGHILTYRGFSLLLVLESVLSGHDNWVMSARWQPPVWKKEEDGTNTRHQPMCLLSASTDKSMCIWRPTASEGIWCPDVKVGEMGGHTLGFYGCAFSPDGQAILANGYSGSFHLWRKNADSDVWTPSVTVSGHAASVNDLCWDAHEDYLLTTGADQTTRLWAPWKEHVIDMPVMPSTADSSSSPSSSSSPLIHPRSSWHEISRPQLHGYDLNCLCPLYDPENVRAHSLASGADEKVVRVFWAPQPFLDTVKRIAGVETIESSAAKAERPLFAPVADESHAMDGDEDDEGEMKMPTPSPPPAAAQSSATKGNAEQLAFLESTASRAVKANLPELGLSNKALMDGDAANNMRGMTHVQQTMSGTAQLSVGVPPPEDYLLSTTLWPEVEKLYGHGYEIISIACNYNGTMLASACVAKKSAHAVIRVWQVRDWTEVLQLESHRSSVVSLAFSPDGRYLLSASKDRHITVFELSEATGRPTLLGSTKLRAHARIVWNAVWAPSRDFAYCATASRDKTVRCFRVTGPAGQPQIVEDAILPAFTCAATAVAFAPLAPRSSSVSDLFPTPTLKPTKLTLAVGLEDGRIEVWQSAPTENIQTAKLQWGRLYAFPDNFCHGGFVKRLAWRWRSDSTGSAPELELASCSQDQSVRIFTVPAASINME